MLFEEINARCVYVRLEGVLAELAKRGDYPQPARQLLAEALLIAALMSSGIKFSGRLSLQVRSEGALKLLIADCTDAGGLRGTVALDEESVVPGDAAGLVQSVGDGGVLTLTLDPAGKGQRWQGIVPLEGATLAEAIAAYFERSEQLPTRFRLAVDGDRAAALMVQRMPGASEDADGWNRLQHLLASASPEELLVLDGPDLLHRLFHAEVRRVFPPRELTFHCPCSRERVVEVLIGLGPAELADMIEEGKPVDVRCQFCNQNYRFDCLDLAALEHGDSPQAGGTVH
ncbi:MAG: Hsp33 family molecular chaperone HslO [Wenzhouxiangella sp.]|nr:MAG: Hsp33 family molecular chaperone HslO [Wenzhouxiangella sp.]